MNTPKSQAAGLLAGVFLRSTGRSPAGAYNITGHILAEKE